VDDSEPIQFEPERENLEPLDAPGVEAELDLDLVDEVFMLFSVLVTVTPHELTGNLRVRSDSQLPND
jgi:hypothetical protein